MWSEVLESAIDGDTVTVGAHGECARDNAIKMEVADAFRTAGVDRDCGSRFQTRTMTYFRTLGSSRYHVKLSSFSLTTVTYFHHCMCRPNT